MSPSYYTIRDYMRAGVAASVVLLALTWFAAFVYWPPSPAAANYLKTQ